MLSNGDVAMRLEGVSKRYYLNPRRPWKLRDLIARPKGLFRQIVPREPFWAIRNLSLEVRRGEILGVIGRNGSGKSTLLRVLVGISPPTTGKVTVNGRVAALLELGSGFHPQVTGRENAYLNALFMGIPKERAREIVPDIIEFSGLHEFADQPVRTYSSGMYLRLAFAVAVHVQPDILVIDEVIAVGDADFQQKCLDHFANLKEEQQTTIVIVTHNVTTLKDFADRVIFIDHGQIEREGPADDVVDEYLNRRLDASPAAKRVFRRALEERGLVEASVADDIGDGRL
jgi:ABC-type polysaccharide/polyol phosphate transport system ATPase subunit